MNVLGLSPVLAIVAAMRRYRPASGGRGAASRLGFPLFWFGDLSTFSSPRLFGEEVRSRRWATTRTWASTPR